MGDFVTGILDIAFYLFDKTDNIIVVYSAGVLFFCLCFGTVHFLLKRL